MLFIRSLLRKRIIDGDQGLVGLSGAAATRTALVHITFEEVRHFSDCGVCAWISVSFPCMVCGIPIRIRTYL